MIRKNRRVKKRTLRYSETPAPVVNAWMTALTVARRDAKMCHLMKTFTVRDLRYRFSEVEGRLQKGEQVEIRRRKRPIAWLVPIRPAGKYPDFVAVQREIFGHRKREMASGADLAALNRGDR